MYKKVAEEVSAKFLNIEGNKFIASHFAIQFILKIIKDFNVTSVLEIGLGIGSISDAILKYSELNNLDITYTGTENNDYCLRVLPNNVEHYNKIDLFEDINALQTSAPFDLIIIDGTDNLDNIKKFGHPNTIIFIEGLRSKQVESIKKLYPKAIHVEVISLMKKLKRNSTEMKWNGGGQLIFLEPSNYRKAYAFKEKVSSFLKRRLRKIV
ncbi:hypothetical protein [Patiriisocius marinus]|uniref:hypothetical protein n=1 Tax=Patiriisocius marinus TaxID=1397112 RepID=UPI0023309402|nr:hypothetical protein [Patiriisocius marinus]